MGAQITQQEKEAKAFINGLKRRQEYIKQYNVLDGGFEYAKLQKNHVEMALIKRSMDEVSSKHIRLNRRIERLKNAYWTLNPEGTVEYWRIYPQD